MTELTRLLNFQIGAHASTSDWTTIAAANVDLKPDNLWLANPGYTAIPQDLSSRDGANAPSLRGVKNLALPDLSFPFPGLSAGGAGDGIVPSALENSLETLLEWLTGGTVLEAGPGDTTVVGDAGSGTSVIMDGVPATPMAAGQGILVQGSLPATHQQLVAREVVSLTTATYTIDRALTTFAGVADTALEDAVVYAAKTYQIVGTAPDRVHNSIDAEWINARRTFLGVAFNAGLTMEPGQYLKLVCNGVQCTDWDDATEVNPTFAAPTAGAKIVCNDMPLWIGSTLYMASGLSFDFGLTITPRTSQGAPNGTFGYVVTRQAPVLSGQLMLGALTAPTQITNSQLSTFRQSLAQSAGTVDAMLQIGRDAGACVAIRIPEGDLQIPDLTDADGKIMAPFTITGTGATAARLHVH